MIRECAGRATVTLKGGSAIPAPARPVVERPPALHASPKDRHHRRRGDQSRCGDARNRKFVDSPLEGGGFEPSVPLLRMAPRPASAELWEVPRRHE